MSKRKETHETRNRTTDTPPNMEPHLSDAPVAADAVATFDSLVRITICHQRQRLADLDGLSGKAAIDGLVEAGILRTDSTQQVAEIRTLQTKGSPEETRIVIETI